MNDILDSFSLGFNLFLEVFSSLISTDIFIWIISLFAFFYSFRLFRRLFLSSPPSLTDSSDDDSSDDVSSDDIFSDYFDNRGTYLNGKKID